MICRNHWHWYTKQLLILNQNIINPFIVITEAEKSQTNRFGKKYGSMITLLRIQIFFHRIYIFLWNTPQHSTHISIPRHNTKVLHLLRIIHSRISTFILFYYSVFHYYSMDRISCNQCNTLTVDLQYILLYSSIGTSQMYLQCWIIIF